MCVYWQTFNWWTWKRKRKREQKCPKCWWGATIIEDEEERKAIKHRKEKDKNRWTKERTENFVADAFKKRPKKGWENGFPFWKHRIKSNRGQTKVTGQKNPFTTASSYNDAITSQWLNSMEIEGIRLQTQAPSKWCSGEVKKRNGWTGVDWANEHKSENLFEKMEKT